jgi:hypothetical protein
MAQPIYSASPPAQLGRDDLSERAKRAAGRETALRELTGNIGVLTIAQRVEVHAARSLLR